MNITVIGAGATGGYFGGRLAESGLNVTFLVRENRGVQLKTKGLVITSPFGNITITEPRISLDSRNIANCDLVLLGVKNYQLAGTIPQLKDLVNRGAKILPLLNGVEHFEILIQEFGRENVLGGICKVIATLDNEGTICQTSKIHDLIFGELEPSNEEFCSRVNQIMSKANLNITYSKDIWVDIWSKYAHITSLSGVTTAAQLSNDQVFSIESTREIYMRSLGEMQNLARAFGVALPDDFIQQSVKAIGKHPKGSTSSMNQDKRKGLPLEVESLQGVAIRFAKRYGLDLPTISTFYGLIKPYENGS